MGNCYRLRVANLEDQLITRLYTQIRGCAGSFGIEQLFHSKCARILHQKLWLPTKLLQEGACYNLHLDCEDHTIFCLDAKACQSDQKEIEQRVQGLL